MFILTLTAVFLNLEVGGTKDLRVGHKTLTLKKIKEMSKL